MRFLHVADVHLGNQQYNIPQRFNDFGRAFLDVAELALTHGAQVVVIAGDLFHKASVEPSTLLQAEEGLRRLQAASIATVAVHGNHDKARYLAQISWLEYLCEQGLLYLLTPDFEHEPLRLLPWDSEAKQGSYVDIGGVRFVGVPWLGAAASRVLVEVADALDALEAGETHCTVLVTHAGVEGQMPNMPGGLTFKQLEPLRGRVNYLALGHLHKPYEVDHWIYNPGSLETCSFDESLYKRGCYLVDVTQEGQHSAQHLQNVQRPFVSIPVKTDLVTTPAALVDAVLTELRASKRQIEKLCSAIEDEQRRLPVVRLVLHGHLTFDRTQVDLDALRGLVRSEIDALTIRVENWTTPLGLQMAIDDSSDVASLEQQVFEMLVRSDSQYSPHVDAWVGALRQFKTLVLEDAEPSVIYDALDTVMIRLEEATDVDH